MKGALIREAWRVALSQRTATIAMMIVAASMCSVVLLTAGTTSASRAQILDSLDSAGARSLVVRFDDEVSPPASSLGALNMLEGVAYKVALGPATDMSAVPVKGAPTVAVRNIYSGDPLAASSTRRVLLSDQAVRTLLLDGPKGSLRSPHGVDYLIGGRFASGDALEGLEPLGVKPTADGPVSVIVIVATSAALVEPLTEQIQSILPPASRDHVRIETRSQLSVLRSVVDRQLSATSQALVLGSLGTGSLFIAVVTWALTVLKRRDLGRRRALGATRAQVLVILTLHGAISSLLGIALGVVASYVAMIMAGEPLPPASFLLALLTLGLAMNAIFAGLPAWLASRRDPVRELRVP